MEEEAAPGSLQPGTKETPDDMMGPFQQVYTVLGWVSQAQTSKWMELPPLQQRLNVFVKYSSPWGPRCFRCHGARPSGPVAVEFLEAQIASATSFAEKGE